MFAFTTDDSDGALNTYKGYSIAPKPNGNANESYVKEFAEAGRLLLQWGAEGKTHSYVVVASDYGYHFLFLSEVYKAQTGYATLVDYLNAEYGEKTVTEWKDFFDDMVANWEDFEDTNNYLYVLMNNLSSTAVNNALTQANTEVLNKYVYAVDNDYVVVYEDRFADLLA
jgi:hypothetical protein